MKRIATPCVSQCWLNPVLGLCEGCGRTRDELANWCFITQDERLAIMAVLPERLQALRQTVAEPVAKAV
jgi:hypothetical protein